MQTVKSILSQLISIGILFIFIFTDFLDSIKEYIPVLWSILIIWSIFYNIKYRKGKVNNEIRFPTNNDDYYKSLSFIMGLIIVIGGICAIFFIEEYFVFIFLMIFNGFLLIVSGLFFIPHGVIEIKNNELNFIDANNKKSIRTENLYSIELKVSSISFIDINQKKHKIDHLNLKNSDFHRIMEFVKRKINKNIAMKVYSDGE